MKRNDLHALTLTAMMIPVIAVAAQLALPIASVPMTLQTFAVCFAGLMLGPMRGVAAVAVYLLMGAIGIPVFAGFTGSLAAVVGPTGGFLVGFLPLVLLAGLAKNKGAVRTAMLLASGLLLCHLAGVLWFAHTAGVSILSASLITSLPYLLKDALSSLFAYLLAKRLAKHRKWP